MSRAEVRELLSATLHGPLPAATMQRVFATLAEVPGLRAKTNPFGMTNEERLLKVSSKIVARALDGVLKGTGVGHICLLLADASTLDWGERTELSFVSDIEVELVPRVLRQFADQLEARIAAS